MTARRGFALLAALWVTVALSAMALVGLLVARDVLGGAQNRITLMRGRWRAEDCLERSRAVIDGALSGRSGGGGGAWEALDRIVAASPVVTEVACEVTLVPTGIAVDVNVADGEQLLALFRAIGFGEPRADSMVDALLDWRDADDIPRPLGAERDWYRAQGRFTPRNGPFADVVELRRVRGFEVLPDSMLDAVFTVEPGRIVWSRAPLTVLASLPGMSEEAMARVIERRSRGIPATDLFSLSEELSPAAQQLLTARAGDLQRLATDRPDAWILVARGGGYSLEVRLAPAGTRAAIVRRRTTP
jgi:general secretion pathway protein K